MNNVIKPSENYIKSNGKYIFIDYCKHGNIEYWPKTFKTLYSLYGNRIFSEKYLLCNECLHEYQDNNITFNNEKLRADLYNIKKPGEQLLQIRHPELYLAIRHHSKKHKDISWNMRLYLYRHNLYELPKCKYCKSFIFNTYDGKTPYLYCSRKCQVKHLQENGHFSNIQINRHQQNRNIKFTKKYIDLDLNLTFDVNHTIIKNYCKHDKDISLSHYHFKNLYKNYGIELKYKTYLLCDDCKKEYLKDENFKIDYYKHLEILLAIKQNAQTESHLYKLYPELYKTIIYFSKHYEDASWSERLYLFQNKLKYRNKCAIKTCNKEVSYCYSKTSYNIYCNDHLNNITISAGESDIFNFIKSLHPNIIQSYRKLGKEIDIFLSDLNLGIEYNGLYWHNENNKERNYHYDKWKLCKDNNIRLISIWEDDWNFKQGIVKSILLNAIGKSDVKVFARNCIIKSVNNSERNLFLDKNHLQGKCPSSINLGLYYNNELVSIMTFGKKRKIMNQKSKINEYELLRFCSKLNTSVIGGASKLFSYFIKHYSPNNIVSYASCDISFGNLYKILGFKEINHTGLNYWWTKNGIKYHRSNFMKHKLVKNGADPNLTENQIMINKGYTKIWGTGNLKYEWNK